MANSISAAIASLESNLAADIVAEVTLSVAAVSVAAANPDATPEEVADWVLDALKRGDEACNIMGADAAEQALEDPPAQDPPPAKAKG